MDTHALVNISTATAAAAPTQRVSLITPEHYARGASLLEPFVLYPEQTSSIIELSIWIDGDDWDSGNERYRESEKSWRVNTLNPWTHDSLGAYVDSLQLGTDLGTALLKSFRRERMEGDARKYRPHCGGSPERHDEIWKDIRQDEAIAVLFMSTCPNIETLRIGTDIPEDSLLQQYLTYGNYGRIPNVLASVKHVEFITAYQKFDDPRMYQPFELFVYLQFVHRLPHLESITMHGVTEGELIYDWFVPRCGKMTKLELTHCDLSGESFETLVLIPEVLVELTFSVGGLWTASGGVSGIGIKNVQRALDAHRKTLTRLDLDIEVTIPGTTSAAAPDYDDDDDDGDDFEGREWKMEDVNPIYREFWLQDMQTSQANHSVAAVTEVSPQEGGGGGARRKRGISLAHFPKLQHLRIGIMSLLGGSVVDWTAVKPGVKAVRKLRGGGARLMDILPPSLVTLTIYGYERGHNGDVDDHVDELLRERRKRLPLLETLEGVEMRVDSLDDVYGYEIREEDVWKGVEQDWTWI